MINAVMMLGKRIRLRIPRYQNNKTDSVRVVALFSFIVVMCLPFITISIAGIGLLLIIGIPFLLLSLPAIARKMQKPDMATMLLLLFVMYGVIGYMWTPNFSMGALYGYIKNATIMMCFYCQVYSKQEKKLIILGAVLACLFVCFFMIFGSEHIEYVEGRATISIFGAAQDPNYIGFLFIVPMAWSVQGFLKDTTKRKRLQSIACCIVMVYCVLLTGSRGTLIGLLVVGIVSAVSKFKSLAGKITFCLITGAVALVGFIALLSLLPENLAARYRFDSMMSSRGTGRFDLWLDSFEALRSAPHKILFGFGTSSSFTVIQQATHNYLIQLLLELGVVGVGLFLGFFCIWFYRLVKIHDILSLSILSGCFGIAMSLSVNTDYHFWIVLTIGIVCRNPNRNLERRRLDEYCDAIYLHRKV